MISNGVITLSNPIEDKENGFLIDKIDLNKLVQKTIIADKKINGIVLSNELSSIEIDEDEEPDKVIKYNLRYEDEKVIMSGIIYKNDKEITKIEREIDIDTLVEQITKSVRNNIGMSFSITTIPVLSETLEEIKDQIYKSSFESNIMLTGEEYNHRINIYSEQTNDFLGVANRAYIENGSLILMETIYNPNVSVTNQGNISIKIIIDEENVVIFDNLTLESSNGKSIKYCSFSLMYAKVAKRKENNDATKLNMKGLKLPYRNSKTKILEDELILLNSQNALIRCYKQNKTMNIKKININKYLLS